MTGPARRKVLLSWSSGKDSAWTLHRLSVQDDIDVVGLVTTVNSKFKRVAMHAVRETLLRRQADAAGLPLHIVDILHPCSDERYDAAMSELVEQARMQGVEAMAFGDLFLEDVRRYREDRLAGTGIEPLFPLWGEATRQLADDMISAGLEATITCVDPKALPARFAGRMFDASFLAELPDGVDPCGENGEFHSFVHAGPMLAHSIAVMPGSLEEREGFVFADLLPADHSTKRRSPLST